MPACKLVEKRFSLRGKSLWMGAVSLCLVFGLSASLFALDFPSIDSPSMPSLSSPSSGPTTPWRGSAPYLPSQQNQTSPQTDSSQQDTKDSAAGLALTAQSISGLGGLEALESLGGLSELTGLSGLGGLNGLDALKSLEALQGVGNEEDLKEYLSKLAGNSGVDTKALEAALEKLQDSGNSSQTGENATATTTPTAGSGSATTVANETSASEKLSTETVATLQQILKQLELLAELQAESAKAPDAPAGSVSNTEAASGDPFSTTNLSPSRILRFRANSTDLLPSCKTVYFSQPDPAGIFLLTGDRVVKAGGKDRNETFYFLFTPTLDAEGKFIYTVEAQLTQDWAAERSELYPLTTALPLTATRTGNLITLRHNSDGWVLDLLLDLREAE